MLFGDRFETIREAGSGGMGVVYQARDRTTGGLVAVKALLDSSEQDRFAREAEVLSRLEHPGIVAYVAHAKDAPAYLAMEWLDGEDLAMRIERGALSIDESIAIAVRVADAIGFAHARGIVHRDLKPSNVFLVGGRADGVKVLDFGLARDAASPLPRRPLTATGAVMGSVGYLAPEQARGSSTLDARCDVFALGCILYECLTAKPAFGGVHAVAILAKLLVEDAPRVRAFRPDAPHALDALVARMLDRDPERRPPDGEAVRTALVRVASASSASSLSTRPSALTRDEQRMMAVVIVCERREDVDGDSSSRAPTMIALGSPAVRAAIESAVAPFDATVDTAADGPIVVAMRGEGAGTDQATRAARCALVVRGACPGPIVALAIGRGSAQSGTVAGEVIDRVASLLTAASRVTSDGVHVEPSVVPLLESRFVVACDANGAVLHAERDALTAGRMLLGHVTPFVGRTREMATLEQAFATSVAEREASAVIVVGVAGSGKSRLREELVASARRREPSVRVWSAQGDAARAQSPFASASALVRAACDGEAIAARVARVIEREADRDRVTCFLTEMLGETRGEIPVALKLARESTALMHDNVTRAWLDFVRAELAHAPVIMLLDDLHWMDDPTLKLVDATLATHREQPLLVVGFGRPETLETHASLWSAHGVQTIQLAPLSAKASEKVVRQVLPGSSGAAIARLVERAAGNPFVLEELVRAHAERASDDVPVGVLALVQMRLEALDPSLRRVLRAASIFGRNARVDGIAHLLGDREPVDDHDDVRHSIRALVEREVLETTREDVSLVRFRHDLVRDASYALLTAEDRATGHALAGAWLEASGEHDAGVLAMHFDLAGERDRAMNAYVRAAEQALDGNDQRAASAHASHAIDLAASGELRARSLYARAMASYWRGDCMSGLDDALSAIDDFERGTYAWFSAIRLACSLSDIVNRRDTALELVTLALSETPTDTRARAVRIHVLAEAAMVHYHTNDQQSGLAFAARLEADALPLRDDPHVALSLHRMGTASASMRNDPYDELFHWQKIRELQRVLGDRRGAVSAEVNVGYGWLLLGAYDRAEATLREVIAIADVELERLIGAARHNLGMVLACRGDFENAIREETLAFEALRAAHDVRLASLSLVYLATIREMAGDLEGAERDANEALTVGESLPLVRPRALAVIARVELRRGRIHEALAIVEELNELAEKPRVEGGGVLVQVVIAETLVAAGKLDEARRELAAIRRAIEASAANIPDAAIRAQFLGAIDHAHALDLATELGV